MKPSMHFVVSDQLLKQMDDIALIKK